MSSTKSSKDSDDRKTLSREGHATEREGKKSGSGYEGSYKSKWNDFPKSRFLKQGEFPKR